MSSSNDNKTDLNKYSRERYFINSLRNEIKLLKSNKKNDYQQLYHRIQTLNEKIASLNERVEYLNNKVSQLKKEVLKKVERVHSKIRKIYKRLFITLGILVAITVFLLLLELVVFKN